jgi:hypothetical protein
VWNKDILLAGHRRSDEDCARQAFIWKTKKSFSQARTELQILQMTVHRVLGKSLCLEPSNLQVVHKLTARDKQLRLQFATQLCTQILERYNFLSRNVFTHEAKFHISEHVSQRHCVI